MLLESQKSALMVVDVQEKLAAAMADRADTVERVRILLQSAQRLEIPILVSEQYPAGIGHTAADLSDLVPASAVVEKTHFSCVAEPGFTDRLAALGRSQIVVCGMETHVCVLQTALAIGDLGYRTFVAADACSSRTEANKAAGLARMASAGIEVVTTEMVVFEWLGRAGTDTFRELLKLIK